MCADTTLCVLMSSHYHIYVSLGYDPTRTLTTKSPICVSLYTIFLASSYSCICVRMSSCYYIRHICVHICVLSHQPIHQDDRQRHTREGLRVRSRQSSTDVDGCGTCDPRPHNELLVICVLLRPALLTSVTASSWGATCASKARMARCHFVSLH